MVNCYFYLIIVRLESKNQLKKLHISFWNKQNLKFKILLLPRFLRDTSRTEIKYHKQR